MITISGTLTGPLMFILPPILYTKMLKMEQTYDNELIKRIIASTSALDDDSEEDYSLRQRRYGTFRAQKMAAVPSKCYTKFGLTICKVIHFLYSDYVLSSAVILFGTLATIASTYFNLFNVKSVKEFWSPCIYNISYSFIP